MPRICHSLLALYCALLAPLTLAASEDSAPEPYPSDYWAMRPVISNVSLSPDGERLALMRIPTKDGNPVIEVYDAADLSKEPFRLDADPMEITSFSWVNDRDIFVSLRQKVRDKVQEFNQSVWEGKLALLDTEKQKITPFADDDGSIVHLLPNDPSKVIVAVAEGPSVGVSRGRAFRPAAYYELDLRKGSRKLILRGKLSIGNVAFDPDGTPVRASGYDQASSELVWYYRPAGTRDWVEYHRAPVGTIEFYPFAPLGPTGVENEIYVAARNGHDTLGLWTFDMAEGEFGEAIYRRSDVDIWSVVRHSNRWGLPDEIVGVTYMTDNIHVEYFDEVEEAIHDQFTDLIPNAHLVRVVSRSRDGQTFVVSNQGPRDPGSYYLLKDGKWQTIGSSQPLLEPERLADLQYISFKARDGMRIPAYLTMPNGEPPFPAVVMPHGGPFARDYGGYDKWAQVLANNGYVVIQPQFRGSDGFGLKHYQAAFEDGGQQGYKMQDDKDDAAAYLIERGLTVADRVAMFGWSYGGYAALTAASRTPQTYQCVVAGAAVSDPLMQINYQRARLHEDVRKRHVKMEELGINPLDEVEKVNVPILMVHGDVDSRVPVEHAKKYLKLLDDHEKDYKYVELEGASHFYNTLFYDHQLTFFSAMIDYLANDCGPGGL